jgi:hypothetical protein
MYFSTIYILYIIKGRKTRLEIEYILHFIYNLIVIVI